MKKIPVFIISALCLLSVQVVSQPLTTADADALSYQYYMAGQWDDLIKIGKQALRNKIDFYYLQVRMGAAYFEKGKYFKAASHYEKAYRQNPDDAYVAESLYYAYLYSGQYEAAARVAEAFSTEQKQRTAYREPPFITAISFDYKHFIPDDYSAQIVPGDILNQTVMLNGNYFETGFWHKFRRGNSFFHQYSHLSLTNRRFAFDNPDLPPVFDEEVAQNQYYLSYRKHGTEHWDYILALHYLNTRVSGINPNGGGRGPWSANNYLYRETGHSYVVSMGIGKQIGNFYTDFSFTFKDISDDKQFQTGIAAKWYPFSNRHLSLMLAGDYWQETDTIENPERALVLTPSIGGYIGSSVYWEASYRYGESRNFTEQYGYIVNNHPDPVLSEYEGLLRFNTTNEKLFLFLKYEYETAENSYLLNSEKQTINYNNQSITGGISWYF